METDKLIVKADSQIINSMNLCPERYRLEMVEHWRPLEKAKALERGSVMHTMLAKYRREKRRGRLAHEHARVVEEVLLTGQVAASGASNMTLEDFEDDKRVFQEYVLRWQYDGWEIIDIEQPFTKLLYEDANPIEVADKTYPGLMIYYEGVIDARVVDPKLGQLVVDSKTESRKSYPYILSNQFQGYEWAFGVPVVVDKIGYQTSLPINEKLRRLVHESGASAIQEWKQDTVTQIKEAIHWHNTGTFMKNRTSCDKYSGCIFQQVCKVPPDIREFKLQAYFYKDVPWDPYTRDDEDETIEAMSDL